MNFIFFCRNVYPSYGKRDKNVSPGMSRAYIPFLRSQSSGKPGLERPTFCGLAPAPPPAPALLGSRAEPSGRGSASSPHCRHPQVIRGVPWSTSDWSLSWFLSPTEHLLCAQTPLGMECSGSAAAVSNRSSGTDTHCSTPMPDGCRTRQGVS